MPMYIPISNRFAKIKKERGECEFKWPSKDTEDYKDHPLHKCNRFRNHRASHKCNCGNSTYDRNSRVKLGGSYFQNSDKK